MKILDRYIFQAFVKSFVSIFFILIFIFILQSIWLYIGELAGKDIDFWVILKFVWYMLPSLIPLVLPLTILVASLMVFGNFAERYEFAAMKSAGISLQRAMNGLMVFILLLAVLVFFFTNNVIPYSNYKWYNLRKNLAKVNPTMAIVEGQFNDIGDAFTIKVKEKFGVNDSELKDVLIYQKNPEKPNGNYRVTIAKTGRIENIKDTDVLTLTLYDGGYYEEVQPKKAQDKKKLPFVKSTFKEQTLYIDLAALNNVDIDQENQLKSHGMYNVKELKQVIDTLKNTHSQGIKAVSDNLYFRSGIAKLQDPAVKKSALPDSLNYLNVYALKQQKEIIQQALNNVTSSLKTIENKKIQAQNRTKNLNKHKIAWHDKYALSIACIVLFFVGAPLGAIIKKGGMGLPLVIAVFLFLTYHFIGIFAKNSAENGTINPYFATWINTLIMFPLSVWITLRATSDKTLIDFDAFFQRVKNTFSSKQD